MDRREILVAFGRVAVVAAAIPAIAQRAKITRVGFLSGASRPVSIQTSVFGSFLRGMRELGYTEDKDFTVEWRFADGRYERFPALAHELISLKVDLIVTGTIAAIESVQRLTTVIPIVNGGGGDPVAQGFASSYARPGGNVTGIASSITEASSKYIELLRTLLPKLSKIAVLANPGNPLTATTLERIKDSARKSEVVVRVVNARKAEEVDRGFEAISRESVEAIILIQDAFFNVHSQQIAALALKYRLPLIASQGFYAKAGGLMAYGEDLSENFRRAAKYVDRIIKGAKPSELAIEQPMKPDLVINLRTARVLGLAIPPELLLRADEVIE